MPLCLHIHMWIWWMQVPTWTLVLHKGKFVVCVKSRRKENPQNWWYQGFCIRDCWKGYWGDQEVWGKDDNRYWEGHEVHEAGGSWKALSEHCLPDVKKRQALQANGVSALVEDHQQQRRGGEQVVLKDKIAVKKPGGGEQKEPWEGEYISCSGNQGGGQIERLGLE